MVGGTGLEPISSPLLTVLYGCASDHKSCSKNTFLALDVGYQQVHALSILDGQAVEAVIATSWQGRPTRCAPQGATCGLRICLPFSAPA